MNVLPNAKYILGLPFARNDKENTIAFVKEGINRIGLDKIYCFELGNEPDGYARQDVGRPNYSPSDYVSDWANWTTDISNALGLQDATYTGYTIKTYEDVGLQTSTVDDNTQWTV